MAGWHIWNMREQNRRFGNIFLAHQRKEHCRHSAHQRSSATLVYCVYLKNEKKWNLKETPYDIALGGFSQRIAWGNTPAHWVLHSYRPSPAEILPCEVPDSGQSLTISQQYLDAINIAFLWTTVTSSVQSHKISPRFDVAQCTTEDHSAPATHSTLWLLLLI